MILALWKSYDQNKQEQNGSKFLTDDMAARMLSLQLGPFFLLQDLVTSGL